MLLASWRSRALCTPKTIPSCSATPGSDLHDPPCLYSGHCTVALLTTNFTAAALTTHCHRKPFSVDREVNTAELLKELSSRPKYSMATPRTPAGQMTPVSQKLSQSPATPGAWKHPKFDEITRRQYATTFDERNVRAIIVNILVLILSFAAFDVLPRIPGGYVSPKNGRRRRS